MRQHARRDSIAWRVISDPAVRLHAPDSRDLSWFAPPYWRRCCRRRTVSRCRSPAVGLSWFRFSRSVLSGDVPHGTRMLRRNRERLTVLGLNDNHQLRVPEHLLKAAALSASTRPGPLSRIALPDFCAIRDAAVYAAAHLSAVVSMCSTSLWRRCKHGVDFNAIELQRQAAWSLIC